VNINLNRFQVKNTRCVPTPEETFMTPTKLTRNNDEPDPRVFLTTIGSGREVAAFHKKQIIFKQGDAADALFYILQGKVRHTVVSRFGKKAKLDILSEEDFFGYCGLAGQPFRASSATAMSDCKLMKIANAAMMLELNKGRALSELFVQSLLTRNIRNQEKLVDQFFGSSEIRVARALLLLADFDENGKPKTVISEVSQGDLAGMTGATRLQVDFSVNRFRKSGFLTHGSNGLQIHSTLLNVVLHGLPRTKPANKARKHL
jgi:CRP/FNR family cyclic AMP-dependent transcriptional regulator